jgi:hypothetical protein
MSALYKLYEKVVDHTIRKRIQLSEDQMGFRPVFSTHTVLLRVELAMKIAKASNTNLMMAGIDFQQAFDRTWRPGIMYRLWEKGITSDIWLIIDDMLSDTKAYVKTNYGPTDPFHTSVGVIQGSVLSALLFAIFITPLSTELTGSSETFGLVKLPPQLFADDATLLATRIKTFQLLLALTLAWANKWGSLINMDKSHIMFTIPRDLPPNSPTLLFPLQSDLQLLGAAITAQGVMNPSQADIRVIKPLIGKVQTKLKAILTSPYFGRMRLDVSIHLLDSQVLSVLRYVLPITPPNGLAADMLQKELENHAAKVIGNPLDIPPLLIMAETGSHDVDLLAHRERLLMIHRTLNNPNDTKTPALMHAVTEQDGRTAYQAIGTTLKALNINLLPATFLSIAYIDIKQTLRVALHQEQNKRWRSRAISYPPWFRRHYRCKPYWGIDIAIANMPNNLASAYILFRLNYRIPLILPSHKTCIFCQNYDPGMSHFLWQCHELTPARTQLVNDLRTHLPAHQYALLSSMDIETLTDHVLGTAANTLPTHIWKQVVKATATFADHIYSRPNALILP